MLIIFCVCLLFNLTRLNSQDIPPELTANSRQAYCPLSQINIAPDFTITDPDDTGIASFLVQISTGYDVNSDILILTGDYTYQWQKERVNYGGSESFITVDQPGRYMVQATSQAGCVSEVKVFTVKASEIATITRNDVIINDYNSNNFIKVREVIFGSGAYEFSVDQMTGPFSNQTLFKNLTPGKHTLYIRDKNGCGTAAFEFIVLNYPQFFTPNEDGINDAWSLKGFDKNFFTVSDIFIYNRFGKLIAKIDAPDYSWDGTYNGKKLPSSDYWYSIILKDLNGYSFERKGHFSLPRR